MIISESSHDHLGASCSNIGRIRTKENIAVDTHFDRQRQRHWGLYDRIRILAQPLWNGFLIVFESEDSKFLKSLFANSFWILFEALLIISKVYMSGFYLKPA